MAHAVLIADGQSFALPEGPTIAMSTVENIAARKFLRFALDDIKFQLEQMSKDPRVKNREFNDAKAGAVMISTYLSTLVQDLDAAIDQAMTRPESLNS